MASNPLCRLCVEEVEPLLDIFGDFGREQDIQTIIAEHFWFEIKEDDPLSDKMCTACWSKLIDFHAFYYRIQKAQERITMVVIEEDEKPFEIEYDEDVKHQLVIAGEENGDEIFNEYKAGSEYSERIGDAGACVGNEEKNIEKYEYSDSTTDAKLPQSPSTIRSVSRISASARLDELSEPSNSELRIDDSTQVASMEEENNDDSDSSTSAVLQFSQNSIDSPQVSSKKRSQTFTKKRHKDEDHALDTSENTSAEKYSRRRGNKNSRILRAKRVKRKESNEDSKQKEIHLIESYYKMQCDLCHEDFGKFQTLFDHYFEAHQFRGFIVCCGKKFFRRAVIAEHVLWHTQPECFTCATCVLVFANKRRYESHMLIHAPPDLQLHQCEQCPKTFVKRAKLDKHKLSHLTNDEKQYVCDECDKPYASETLLRAHKRVVHQQTYAHMCEICARVFKSRIFFEKHQLEHLGQNLPKVQCQICDAWMKNEHTMRAHMRNHQDEGQEHECDICGKKGPSRNAIAKHKRFVHLSERKFKCTLCDKAFKRAISLKEHMTVHTGEVLYTCNFCPKTFNSGANMHAHRKKAHPTEWLEDKQSKLELMKSNEVNV